MPKKSMPKESMPKEPMPKESMPKKSMPKESMSKESMTKERIPKESISKFKIPRPLPTALLIASALIFVLLIFSPGVRAHDGHRDGHAAASHEHKEFQDLKNPVAGNFKALIAGRKIYRTHCAKCHGDAGKGNGPGAKSQTPPPADLTKDPLIHGSTDGEMFKIISDGVPGAAMPAFSKILGESDVWKVVEAVKSMRGK
jgi:hypothetical protein